MNKKNATKILLIVLGIISIVLLIKFMPKLIMMTVSLEEFKKYILSMGRLGAVTLIFFQVLQTVIAPIPGEVVQIAGGYLYGNFLGTLYNMIGLTIGAGMAFYFTRLLGRDFVEKQIQKKNLKWVSNIMDSKKFELILFIIFVVPGLPKDFMIYVSGVTAIKPIRFFTILILSRLPWIMASASVGSNINAGNYVMTIIISVVAVTAFALGMFYKNRIIEKLSKKTS